MVTTPLCTNYGYCFSHYHATLAEVKVTNRVEEKFEEANEMKMKCKSVQGATEGIRF